MGAWNAQNAHAITRAEILEGYKTELKPAYNDPSLSPAVTAICQLIARRLHPILPDTSQLDYDLDEKQNQYFKKIAIQLDLDKQTRGFVAWRIFRDACKAEVGYYNRTTWSEAPTEQLKARYRVYRACKSEIVPKGRSEFYYDEEIYKVCGPKPRWYELFYHLQGMDSSK
ncbi:MAG: hypothetical protein F4201_04460 [Nitrospira sp. SB0677_bin_15]|nr:hypothetical protein [Nitrospira sp. SB0661_bin_20]MYG40058.1 hypothetical protein [Nitrospira sp. SB0677_bin_15]MYH02846.1 hypothetical protein [Nitrospira sp. SB0675_bin_23]MYJ22208.1 hypothetical protein [Nitrospira sp. SB0673_bin_12]